MKWKDSISKLHVKY